jgi:hypothetical protein
MSIQFGCNPSAASDLLLKRATTPKVASGHGVAAIARVINPTSRERAFGIKTFNFSFTGLSLMSQEKCPRFRPDGEPQK